MGTTAVVKALLLVYLLQPLTIRPQLMHLVLALRLQLGLRLVARIGVSVDPLFLHLIKDLRTGNGTLKLLACIPEPAFQVINADTPRRRELHTVLVGYLLPLLRPQTLEVRVLHSGLQVYRLLLGGRVVEVGYVTPCQLCHGTSPCLPELGNPLLERTKLLVQPQPLLNVPFLGLNRLQLALQLLNQQALGRCSVHLLRGRNFNRTGALQIFARLDTERGVNETRPQHIILVFFWPSLDNASDLISLLLPLTSLMHLSRWLNSGLRHPLRSLQNLGFRTGHHPHLTSPHKIRWCARMYVRERVPTQLMVALLH
ncbi:hypothetical protein, conserved in T. vivax [Trypanosoma vivax Y486]|uniref:Secreted protein n=1 Tax=Trypanosoma vivax (strain Y486) TaxID=1055687 RepID=F9WRE6_TRYVY|nr:hypothetical protein, conserved in T. vivax [Trypanosoma vivax Y486]|eukprot:CCD20130.1 hypothetical protein, conserved in T. vivax [Trypanosoma vivax Y486]